jgi:hypothetical protein
MHDLEVQRLAELMIYLAAVIAWSAAGPGQEGLSAYHQVKALGEKKWTEMTEGRV